MEVSFTINGRAYSISPASVPIDTSLNNFIRNHAKLTGTKFMCLEAGCGVCVVTLKGFHPATKQKTTWATNSCLQPIYSCHGLDIITVEGIGSKKNGMHKVQQRLAHFNGTQCGYCSPGMVMNMYSLLESKGGSVTMKEIENSFGGNICRCTGYRPIMDAFKSLASDADKKLLDACRDIEDFDGTKTCPKSGTPCAGKCSAIFSVAKRPINLSFGADGEWHKVYSIKEIFNLFGKIGDKLYMLVAGNTAHGVIRRSPDLKVFIDVASVEELRGHKLNPNSLELGGGVNLTDTMEIFTKTAKQNKNFEYLIEVVKHIDIIANVLVRNNGTIAGNFMIKNGSRGFPSDLFITFQCLSAVVTVSDGTKTYNMSPKEFVGFNMNKKVFVKITLPAYDHERFLFRSFKIMPRAQNAHAYVNAAFQLEVNDKKNAIVGAKICFGGIDEYFVHAEKAQAFLKGKDPFSNETVQGALNVLKTEVNPDLVLPDATPKYRKNLALALFYKFMLMIVPEAKANSKFKSGGMILHREVSTGTQVFDTYEKNWPLTKNIPKIEADVQCTGEAKYVNDFPSMPDELFAAFVTAKLVHGKIASIDASRALKVAGVVAFYSAKDIPGVNNFAPLKATLIFEMEEIFCSSEVKFYGQPVGVIVANTSDLANKAAELVNITYEGKPTKKVAATLYDILEKAPERIVPLPHFSQPEVLATESESDQSQDVDKGPIKKIKGRLDVGSQYHYTMEPQTSVVIPTEDGIDVYSATQYIDATQMAIAEALKLPNSNVNCCVRRVGGAYGAKITRSIQIAAATALAAFLLNRPVRFIMTIEANMMVCGKRYACIGDYEVEFDSTGKIRKLKNDYIENAGCSSNEPIHFHTTEFTNNCYDHSNFVITAKNAITDAPSSTWCRAPGTIEGLAMIENIMEHIARQTGKDPLEIRMRNMKSGNEMEKLLPSFAKSVDYYKRKKEIDAFNAANRWVKRGIGIVPLKYHLGYFGSSHATVSIYHGDGSVAISIGSVEMGQGVNTKAAQTAAHILGVPMEKISIKPTNTLTTPNAVVTGASIGSEVSCYALKVACEQMNERLKPIRRENPKAAWSELIDKAYDKNVDLLSTYMYKVTDLKDYDIWAASCGEVEVDVLTGNILLKRFDVLEDVGESMSPGIDVGQIEGAFVMGLGYWLHEALVFNRENGELLTNRTWTYKPPGAKDIPLDFRVNFIRKSSNPFGVLRSKATGEPASALAVVVIMALRHAIDSARKDSGLKVEDEHYHLGAPTSSETIFLAANNMTNHFLLK